MYNKILYSTHVYTCNFSQIRYVYRTCTCAHVPAHTVVPGTVARLPGYCTVIHLYLLYNSKKKRRILKLYYVSIYLTSRNHCPPTQANSKNDRTATGARRPPPLNSAKSSESEGVFPSLSGVHRLIIAEAEGVNAWSKKQENKNYMQLQIQRRACQKTQQKKKDTSYHCKYPRRPSTTVTGLVCVDTGRYRTRTTSRTLHH